VQDFAIEEGNRLDQPMRLDVGNKRVELFAFHQGEDIRERMEFEFFAHAADSSSFGGMPRMPLRAPKVAFDRRSRRRRTLASVILVRLPSRYASYSPASNLA